MSGEAGKKSDLVKDFIARWRKSGAAERANFQLFAGELCDILGVAPPEPAGPNDADNAYVFERTVTFHHMDGSTSTGRIDLYKRGCFVLEAKQGSDQEAPEQFDLVPETEKKTKKGTAVRGTKGWDDAMVRARGQAEGYAKALPAEEGWSPFLIVVDVGHSIELYADFSLSGKHYTQFPDAHSFRIMLGDLKKPETRERLTLVWTDPLSLDPAKRSAEVTKEIADRLALLAKSLEAAGHAPKSVATFLMRCLFTMFAEDVGLIPEDRFTELLESLKGDAGKFHPMVKKLWEVMNTGGFSAALRDDLLKFNGGLFENSDALPIDEDQLALLTEAARAEWQDVEPAIFGTLLERALDPHERHKLGAHYTPRAYVERLIMPTVIEPLRDDWENVKAAAVALAKKGGVKDAIRELKAFHHKLCGTRVLDPACGSGNFLYVAMEHMKRLEGEVLDLMAEMGEKNYLLELGSHTVDPQQFLGIEVNPRGAVITELVLWIGYLQWHFRTRGRTMPEQPVLRNFHNIEDRDAVLAWDSTELVRDENGNLVTRWDGLTTKPHPTTGREVPDETAQVESYIYKSPRPADWPETDFIVGNPPFVGTKRMRSVFGDGYVDALRKTIKTVPDSADYVTYWWDQAANLLKDGRIRRFGFIATNSLGQSFNRKVLENHLSNKNPVFLIFAIPNHPWVDYVDGAAVRISMTVCSAKERKGKLMRVVSEQSTKDDTPLTTFITETGQILPNLSIGANVLSTVPLNANAKISGMGVALHGSGFILNPEEAKKLRATGSNIIMQYIGGKDLLQTPRKRFIIDFSRMSESEARRNYPAAFQHVIDHVKPERDQNRRKSIRELWWRFGWERPLLRKALAGLTRYIGTTETAKHRIFQFISGQVIPDHMIIAIASDDAWILGVLSSRPHLTWTKLTGGTLEDRPRYNKNVCFNPFPFPDCTDEQKKRIRELGEQLDKHRKDRQAEHPELTLTGMYNVLEKLRSGGELTDPEKDTHDKGLVATLKSIHDDLDAAVLKAYGWPKKLDDEEILERLVALNHERAGEERKGMIRWLRPEYQEAKAKKAVQEEMDVGAPVAKKAKPKKRPWPKALPEQVEAVRAVLAEQSGPVGANEIAKSFKGARKARIKEVLETLAALGRVRNPSIDLFGL